ncbi:MAG: MBOAT family protein [Flavobacteriales bacterium]|nr:MBOAT family protein [Flavobacteriales bacterium]
MIFNSLPFVAFLVIVFMLHWMPRNPGRRYQNSILLVASYVFYGWWDPRFLLLLFLSSAIDFWIGLRMGAVGDGPARKRLLLISLVFNLGMLGFFKYFNFFIGSLQDMFGWDTVPLSIRIILPVGVSFYTFQSLSYTIDVYRKQLQPTPHLVDFLTFVSFFPQLVAGPIERASAMLPQYAMPRRFDHDQAVIGCRYLLYGAFKKIVVADRLAPYVDGIFAQQDVFGGGINVLGLVLFSIQIYCDFSGYSDMAIGLGKLFGVDLMTNFNRPYFSTTLRELWSRWHISLSTWFRDYVYIPLGGSRGTRWFWARNLMLTFILSGLWHGANWTFIIWGTAHGAFLVLERITGFDRWRAPALVKWTCIMVPFLAAVVFFRAPSATHAANYLAAILSPPGDGGSMAQLLRVTDTSPVSLIVTFGMATLLFGIDRMSMLPAYVGRFQRSAVLRRIGYGVLIVLIGFFGVFTDARAFIYFQF